MFHLNDHNGLVGLIGLVYRSNAEVAREDLSGYDVGHVGESELKLLIFGFFSFPRRIYVESLISITHLLNL